LEHNPAHERNDVKTTLEVTASKLRELADEAKETARQATMAADILQGKRKPVGRVLSKDARGRIAAAQRKRWAKVRQMNKGSKTA
jgi:hypothetical protein